MSIEIRARVRKRETRAGQLWIASAHAKGTHFMRVGAAHSHPEALQLAYQQIRQIDAQLMSDVHESRASRRTTITTEEPTA